MQVTYVTALFNIYNNSNEEKTKNRLLNDVRILLRQKFPLVIYIDEYYFNQLNNEIKNLDKNKICIRINIDNINIYNTILKLRDSLSLPANRNMEKDTIEYMALMNSKIELVAKSLSFCTTPYISWIDAGISKMFNDKQKFLIF
jgi:hypothetical protein